MQVGSAQALHGRAHRDAHNLLLQRVSEQSHITHHFGYSLGTAWVQIGFHIMVVGVKGCSYRILGCCQSWVVGFKGC